MSRLVSVALLALALVLLLAPVAASPGHMQHQYYKTQERERQEGLQRAARKAEWGGYRSGAEPSQISLLSALAALATAILV